MASTGRPEASDLDLLDELKHHAQNYPLLDTLRALERVFPDRARLGESLRLSHDPVYLRQEPSLIFAPATIHRFEFGKAGEQCQLYNFAYGIFGPNGPQPIHITEYAYERARHFNDRTLARFADIFHHRYISLLYRAWANTQPAIEMDRPENNRFDLYVGALAGVYVRPEDRGKPANYRRFFRAGLYNMECRSADSLSALIADVFQVPVTIDQFQGGWLALEQTDYFRIGASGSSNRLGVNTCLGARVFDCQHKFSLSIGVVSYDRFVSLLPHTESFQTLFDLVGEYVGLEYDWDLKFQLDSAEVPGWTLGSDRQLGWNLWLGDCREKGAIAEVDLPSRNASAFQSA